MVMRHSRQSMGIPRAAAFITAGYMHGSLSALATSSSRGAPEAAWPAACSPPFEQPCPHMSAPDYPRFPQLFSSKCTAPISADAFLSLLVRGRLPGQPGRRPPGRSEQARRAGHRPAVPDRPRPGPPGVPTLAALPGTACSRSTRSRSTRVEPAGADTADSALTGARPACSHPARAAPTGTDPADSPPACSNPATSAPTGTGGADAGRADPGRADPARADPGRVGAGGADAGRAGAGGADAGRAGAGGADAGRAGAGLADAGRAGADGSHEGGVAVRAEDERDLNSSTSRRIAAAALAGLPYKRVSFRACRCATPHSRRLACSRRNSSASSE
jgi:hypothetical protein